MIDHRNVATIFLLITSIAAISAEDKNWKPFECPDMWTFSGCYCSDSGKQFRFECSTLKIDMDYNIVASITGMIHQKMMVKPVVQTVKLDCKRQYDLDSWPNLDIGNISLLEVTSCVLYEPQPILETFSFLGVNKVRGLRYDAYTYLREIQYSPKHFEGLESLENLTLSRGGGILGNALEQLSNLKRLKINWITLKLQRGMFDSLHKLEVLSLEYNMIDHIEDGLFKNQGNLQVLSLACNKIINIRKEVFNGLKKLRVLDIRLNNIASLDTEVFTLLLELTELNIGQNPISSFPERMLSANRKLETFSLSFNRYPLESLPRDFLANFPLLKNVSLGDSRICDLPGSVFSKSTNIVELNLAYNRLTSLPETLLRDQHQLELLDLSHNLLETIPDGLLKKSLKLVILCLSYNRLQSVSGNVFAYLKSLKVLYLDNNSLHTIDNSAFIATSALDSLYLQNNQLAFHATSYIQDELNIDSSDNTPFQYLGKLRTFKLRNNSISTIFKDWNVKNPKLRELDLRDNRISQLQFARLQFQSSIFVDLTNNNISLISFPRDELRFNRYQEIEVDLSYNPLDCNCNVLDFVKYVQGKSSKTVQFKTRYLRCAEPENLRDTPVEAVKTEDLNCMLNGGCPEDCSCDLRQEDNTIVVNCNGLGLTHIPQLPLPELFKGFKSIELHFENNLLTELPTTNLLGYNQVTRLYARNNSIERLLPENLPSNLHFLDVSQNQLQTVDDSTIAFLNRSSTLSEIRLSKNRWRCNCEASRLLNFIQQNQNRIVNMSEIRCNGTDLPFGSIAVNDLCNEDLTRLIVICIAVAIMGGLTVGLFSTLFYRYQTEVKMWLFTHNLFLWLITEEELDRDKRYDAFLSYSHLDEDFITDHLVPTLEKEPMNFKTCWHVRDFTPGEMIITQIIKSIEDSRRTVIVLSKNFLQSHWAKEEFRQAHVQSMEDNRVRLIIIIYDDIGDVEKLDPELRAYLKTNTYVKWGDPWFWDKLRYAMPHPLKIKGVKQKDFPLQQMEATAPTKAEQG